ncbi:acyl carrier protein phosphodiesterase [Nonlabens sp.]|uniref:acyl carrier protein phosphodiesterase n=1 Tax=Nonlabens sp. TaxID=1888209 RepID=UPI0025F8A52E|nr:acyl carrier protein phosphodiesterase [Nonlabens sp.]
MNYLAHIYLSKEDKELRIGNFIADAVKGKDFSRFPIRVAQGIILHRHIDTFTDTHPVVRKSKDLIRGTYGHWSGVIVDMYYDHFLAANWLDFHEMPLSDYVQGFYKDLQEQHDILPERVQRFLPYMIEQNWLYNYATVEGISRIFEQMNHRTKGKSNMNFAPIELLKYYQELEKHFRIFFKDLKNHVEERRLEL